MLTDTTRTKVFFLFSIRLGTVDWIPCSDIILSCSSCIENNEDSLWTT